MSITVTKNACQNTNNVFMKILCILAVSVIINQIRKKTMHNVSIYEYRLNELYGPDEQDIKYRPDERDDYDYATTATEIDKYESQISEDDMNTVTTLDCGWAES